jgi:hypothetical protein
MFGLKLSISGTSTYTFFLGLFSEKKKYNRDEKLDPVLKEKAAGFICF